MPGSRTLFYKVPKLTLIATMLAMGLATAALAGWVFDIEILKRLNYSWESMKVNTALAILCAAVSLLFYTSGDNRKLAFVFAAFCFSNRGCFFK